MKEHVARFICIAALCGMSLAAMAQDNASFPTRPIKLVVPATAGGEPDILARLVAQSMATDLGQPIVVENKVGAGGLSEWPRCPPPSLTGTRLASCTRRCSRCLRTSLPRSSSNPLRTSPRSG